MNKKSILYLLLLGFYFLMPLSGQSQTPTFRIPPAWISGSNVFPLAFSSNSNLCQFLYLPTDFQGPGPVQAGIIDTIFIMPSSTTASASFTNFTVRMAHTTSPGTIVGAFLTGNFTTVVPPQSKTFTNVVQDVWLPIPLDTPFIYDGVSNLIVEIGQSSYTSGIYLRVNTSPPPNGPGGNRRIWGDYNTRITTTSSSLTGLLGFGYSMVMDCDGTPQGGTAVANPTQPNCNTPTEVSLVGSTLGTGLSYQWQYNEGNGWINFGTDTNRLMSPPITGATQIRSIITCTNLPGGVDTSAPVSVSPAGLVVSLGADTIVCSDALPVSLSPTFSGTAATYLWNDFSTGDTLKVHQAGDYFVQVTNAFGCSGRDTVHVEIADLPLAPLNDSLGLCDGNSAFLDAQNTGASYLWSTNETTQTISVNAAGWYQVQITNQYGCVTTDSTYVLQRPLPMIDLGGDTSVCGSVSVLLDASPSNATSYLWSNSQTSPVIYTTDSGIYWVEITDAFGCQQRDSLHLSFLGNPISEGFNFIPDFRTTLGLVHFRILNPKEVQMAVWDYGDESPLDTAMSPSHVFPVGQHVYGVTLHLYNICDSFSTSLPIEINTTTGLVQIQQSADLVLYPNPTKNHLKIISKEAIKQLSLYDAAGRKVQEKQYPKGLSEVGLETKSLAPGWYLIKIIGVKGTQVKQFSKE